jgi:hypothetical protein
VEGVDELDGPDRPRRGQFAGHALNVPAARAAR